MRIKSYECKRFAGLKDISVDFKSGLNVILGPNESGKSTIIEGIHSTLFKDIRLRNNNNLDKDFSFKFMPKPSGDFIDGKLVLKLEDEEFQIYKEWGSSESEYFVDSKGSIYKDKNEIKDEISKLLNYGESTYTNIVFAKQRDLKIALESIIKNSEITSEINDLLRQTMMELDGISIDRLEADIDMEIDNLYKRWDRAKNFPEKNRGISNPYKTGLGLILATYYKKEGLKLSMDQADKWEKEYERICSEVKSLKDKRDQLNEEKTELEKIEEDVNIREILETKISAINKELEELSLANRQWPMTEELIKQIDAKIDDLKPRRQALGQEKKDFEKIETRNILEKKIKKMEEIELERKSLVDEISKITDINQDHIDSLKKLEKQVSSLETSIRASKILATLKKPGSRPIYLSTDLGQEEILHLDRSIEANGRIHIRYDDFEIEISTGEADFEALSKDYKATKEDYQKLLKDLQLHSLEAGMLNFERLRSKNAEKSLVDRELSSILDGEDEEELKSSLKQLENIEFARDLDEIERELEALNREEVELSSDKKTKENQIKLWQDKYQDHDNLFDLVVEARLGLKEKNSKLECLKPLPAGFLNIEDFKSRLKFLKEETRVLDLTLEGLVADQYNAKDNLLEDSFQEYKKSYKEAEADFAKALKRGEKFLEIQRVFLETKERLSNDPMDSLVDEFARILELITSGSYKSGHIDENFHIRLENANGAIPIELLSAGTYDAVSLALRFSLLKHIFKDSSGYVILDDCLVDLDPERKIQSIDLINNMAKDYQIIFTTCDPRTASMLGGHLIEL